MQGVRYKVTRIEQLISLDKEKFQADLVNLLHELEYCKSEEGFVEIVGVEPQKGLNAERFNYVIVAGIIEFYSLRKSYGCPDWVFDEQYKLDEPWFALDDAGEYKARLFIYSPACFARRNIFISGETLIPI